MKKIDEQVFMDPVYGNIYVNYEVILNIIDSKAMQRLRRIRQLSSVSIIYHGAEHSRFSHALGTYHIACKFLTNSDLKNRLNERERLLFLASALLHDVGHGPHSHTFEQIFKTDHEKLGTEIILNNVELVNVLNKVDPEFKTDIVSVILKEGKFPLIEQLISSQLDVDRIDYLLRDAYYTGAPYGNIDLDRLIRVLVIKDMKAYFKISGISAIENYLINRYHMYNLVYFHRVCRAHEANLENIYLRVKDLMDENYSFKSDISLLNKLLTSNKFTIDDYLLIDDYYINGLISSFRLEEDLILKTLASDYLDRVIWSYIDYDQKEVKKINLKYSEKELKYFTKTNLAYAKAYEEKDDFGTKINILKEDGSPSTLYKESLIIKKLSDSLKNKDKKYFYRQ